MLEWLNPLLGVGERGTKKKVKTLRGQGNQNKRYCHSLLRKNNPPLPHQPSQPRSSPLPGKLSKGDALMAEPPFRAAVLDAGGTPAGGRRDRPAASEAKFCVTQRSAWALRLGSGVAPRVWCHDQSHFASAGWLQSKAGQPVERVEVPWRVLGVWARDWDRWVRAEQMHLLCAPQRTSGRGARARSGATSPRPFLRPWKP